MKKGTVTIVFGGQAGSEAKGKICSYLAEKKGFRAAVSSFMPNAGHTTVLDDGTRIMTQTLPQAIVDPDLDIYLSAGSAIDPKIFFAEMSAFSIDPKRVHVHPRALVIQDIHKEREAAHLNRVSSTLKGCGEALADKARRSADTVLAATSPEISPFVDPDFAENLLGVLIDGGDVLLEVAQGFDLDVNHGISFPYCTSRQTTPLQAMADAGLPHTFIGDIYAVVRPYPIRVGDAFDKATGEKLGTSGPYPGEEISWEEVAERSGTPREEITELATVTKKLRRVFEPNFDRLALMVAQTGANKIALNFTNYIDHSTKGATKRSQISERVWNFVDLVETTTGAAVTLLGTGEKMSEIVDLETEVKSGVEDSSFSAIPVLAFEERMDIDNHTVDS